MSDLIGQVQQFGVLSAAAVVERYAGLVERALDDDILESGAGPGLADIRDPSWLVDRAASLATAYLRFLDRAASSVVNRPRAAPGSSVERVSAGPVGPGGSAEIALWVHNPTTGPIHGVGVEVTALVSSAGDAIGSEAITREPDGFDLEPSSSVEISIRIAVPPRIGPGRYLGLARASVAPDEPVLVELLVEGVKGT